MYFRSSLILSLKILGLFVAHFLRRHSLDFGIFDLRLFTLENLILHQVAILQPVDLL